MGRLLLLIGCWASRLVGFDWVASGLAKIMSEKFLGILGIFWKFQESP